MDMSKILHSVLKVVLSLILVMPVLGATGIFPEPTRDMYNSDAAFNFVNMIMNDAGYIQGLMVLVFVICLVLLWVGREALAAVLLMPITLNIIGFHAFLDGGLFTGGAVLGNVLFLINLYLLYKNKERYDDLLESAN